MAVKNSSDVQISEQEIIISRVFNAPRALVWKVWTERRHLARWWGPKGFTTQVLEMDLRAGGVLHLQLRGPDGTVYPCKGIYSEILELERIVYRGAVEKTAPAAGRDCRRRPLSPSASSSRAQIRHCSRCIPASRRRPSVWPPLTPALSPDGRTASITSRSFWRKHRNA